MAVPRPPPRAKSQPADAASPPPHHESHSRYPHEGGKVRELRFHLLRQQTRVTYWLAPGRRVVLLTVFHKTRSAETAEVQRAIRAQQVCETGHTAAAIAYHRGGKSNE
jgi:Phage derived protein Gp49-like (DUF891)